MPIKLDIQHKHILRLIRRDADPSGWTSLSEQLFPTLSKMMPEELVIFEKLEHGGRAKLSKLGTSVLDAMDWL